MKSTILYIIVLLAAIFVATERGEAKGMPVEIVSVQGVTGAFPKINLQATIANNTRRAITIMPLSRITLEDKAAIITLDDKMRLEPKTTERKTIALDCQVKLIEVIKLKQKQEVRVKLELLVKVGKAKKTKKINHSFSVPLSYLKSYLKF